MICHLRRAGRVRSERGPIYISVHSVQRRGKCRLCTVERCTREWIQDWQRCKEEHMGTQPWGVENNIQIHTKNKEISGTFLADKNYIGNHSAISPSADFPYTVFQYGVQAAYMLYLDILWCREYQSSFCCSFQMEEIAQKFPHFWSDLAIVPLL